MTYSRTRSIQSSLIAGELSADVRGSSDLQAYFEGAERLDNFLPMLTGGAEKRGGWEFLGEVSDSSKMHRLIPFRFGRAQTFQIEFTDLEARIRSRVDGAYLEDSGSSVIVLTTSVGQNDLAGITWFQSADVVFLGHVDNEIAWSSIKRYADDDWQIGDFSFTAGPWLNENASAITIASSGTIVGAGVTLSASGPVFAAGQVGGLFYLKPAVASLGVDLWQENTSYSSGDRVSYGGRVYQATTTATSGYYAPIHDEGSASDGGVNWSYLHDGFGVVEITAVASALSATGVVRRAVPSTTATKYWAEGAVSQYRGFPAVGLIHEERFWLFNTPAQPDTAHASRSYDYGPDQAGFKPETAFGTIADDDGFSATVADGEVNPIIAALSADRLYVFTEAGVKRISGPTQDEPITAGGRVAREVSTIGARKGLRPVKADDAVVYVRADGRGLQEMPYSGADQRDLLVRARQAAASPFVDVVAALYPYRCIYALREDGRIYALLYSRIDNVVAWSEISVAGNFAGAHPICESLSVIPGEDGADELWAVFKRTINGGVYRSVERLRRPFDDARDRYDEQRYLDSHILVDRWNGDPSKTMTLTLDDAGATQPGDTGVLTAAGHTPFSAGQVGDEVWLRRSSAPARASDELGPLKMEITAFTNSGEVVVALVSSAMSALTGSALSEWAFPSSAVTGLSHLEGEAVNALADGVSQGPFTVSAGAITLDEVAARVVVGLGYTAELRSMPIEPGSAIGSGRGAVKHVEELTAVLKNTVGGTLGVYGARYAEAIAGRLASDPMGRAVAPKTIDVTVRPGNDFQREAQLQLLHSEPTACTVLGIGAEVTVHA